VPLVRNSHRRAGYYVLLAPDVPAVLLELGFLSNIADEKRLNKVSEQNKIMKATIKAINGYFNAKKP
jgi:N-acetylmuramoyl-L-alanine amidase